MEGETATARVGAAAGVIVAVLVVFPYVIGPPAAVGAYYAPGPVGPPVAAVFALIASLLLVAASRGRTDPVRAAGAVVVLGAVVTLSALAWALAVTPDLAGGFTAIDLVRYHRHAVVLAGAGLLGAGVGYTRAVLRS